MKHACYNIIVYSAIVITKLTLFQVGVLDIDGTPYDIFTGENVIGRDALSDIVINKGVSLLQFVRLNQAKLAQVYNDPQL